MASISTTDIARQAAEDLMNPEHSTISRIVAQESRELALRRAAHARAEHAARAQQNTGQEVQA